MSKYSLCNKKNLITLTKYLIFEFDILYRIKFSGLRKQYRNEYNNELYRTFIDIISLAIGCVQFTRILLTYCNIKYIEWLIFIIFIIIYC